MMTNIKTVRNMFCTLTFAGALLISSAARAADPVPTAPAPDPAPTTPAPKEADAAKPIPVQLDTAATPASAPAPDSVVVELEGSKLTQAELDATMLQAIQAKGLDQLPPEMMDRVKSDLKPSMIDGFVSKVLLQKDAESQGFKVDAAEVDKTIAGIRGRFDDAESFAAILKENSMTEADLRKDIETEMRIKQLLDKCIAGMPAVSKEDIKAFYDTEQDKFRADESAHARHVLVACADTEPDETKAEKKALAEKVRKKIVDGSKFDDVAREHSDCPSGKNGGDLGTFGRGQMVGPFEDAAFKQKIDEVGPVVTTEFGYHIIQVLERTEAGVTPLADVSDKISDYLKTQREQEVIVNYIDGLKKKSKITYRDPQPETPAKPSTED